MSAKRWPPGEGGTWIIDLDGVVWLAGQGVPGSASAVSALRDCGVRTVFATNNSVLTLEELHERLMRVGIEVAREDLVTSAQAVATLVEERARVLVIAGDGVVEALQSRSAEVLRVPRSDSRYRLRTGYVEFDGRDKIDAVVVGWSKELDFETLSIAAAAVRDGAALLATNDDPTYPTPKGPIPGAGSMLAALSAASGMVAEVAGKPNTAMVRLIEGRCDDIRAVVGDRESTDGRLAERLGVPFALVLSGVTPLVRKKEQLGSQSSPLVAVRSANLSSLVATYALR